MKEECCDSFFVINANEPSHQRIPTSLQGTSRILTRCNLGPSLENMGLKTPMFEQSPNLFERCVPEGRSHIGFSQDTGYRSFATTNWGPLFPYGWLSQMKDCFVCYSLKPN